MSQPAFASSYTNAGPAPNFGGNFFPGDSGDYNYDDDDDQDNGQGDGEGGRDSKRRRIARACDMCRKKKIKCDGKMPKCGHCENYKTECIFTHVEKKRNPPKGAKYIEGLENRLGRMESLLRLSGLLAEDDGGRTDLGTLEKRLAERSQGVSRSNAASPQSPASAKFAGRDFATPSNSTPRDQPPNGATPLTGITSPEPPGPKSRDSKSDGQGTKQVDALADQMCSLITNRCGETRYIGSSSGFSIFSPKGIQWVNDKTGDASFQQMIASATDDGQRYDHWKPEVFTDLFARRTFKALPPRAECYSLLRDYFENFNCMFPLFHEPTFMHLVDKHYSLDPYEGSGWWASLNVALAIAHRLRVMSNITSQEEDEQAWGYLKNALGVLSELTMRNTDLLSVQALLGMALFMQGTPNPQPSFFLVAAAIRLSHCIGLHKRGAEFNLNEAENEQRKRVFWIAYLLDKDICLRSGRPPAQDDDDMNVELPSEDPIDNIGNVPLAKEENGRTTMNLFRQMCTFAQIQSQVYKRLYSVKASRQSDGELLNTIGELDSLLEEWKDSMPLDFRPEHEIKAAHTPLILHVVVLHFAYYNCLTTIHRMSVHHGYWTSRLSDFAIQGLNARPLNPRVFMSAALCVNAARTSIGLIRYIPQGDYACVWLILYYPVSSLVTLFANILQNPQDARARSDLKLMASVVSFLNMLERDSKESSGNVRRILGVCSEFERIARVVLDKAERDMKGRGKRKQAEREREKDRKQPDGHAVGEVLEGGKSWEQLQVETQAPYRRPVQTPSLRASMAASDRSSPSTWGRSPGPEMNNMPNPSAVDGQGQSHQPQPGPQGYVAQAQSSNGQWHNSPFTIPNGPNPNLNTSFPPEWQPAHGQQQQQQQPSGTTGFSPPDLNNPLPGAPPMDFGNAAGFGNGADMNGNRIAPGMPGSGGGAFQQPFVPQDLWQMPMTLEWDWAEGLGLGSFTPGPMFDGSGGYMDANNPMGGGGVQQ